MAINCPKPRRSWFRPRASIFRSIKSPASVSVIDSQEIENKQIERVADAFA